MDPQTILMGLVQRGIPAAAAQGIVANMMAESGLNPGINERSPLVAGSRGGYGLNQWTGPRRVQYEQFAHAKGASPDDLNTQLDFTVWELQNTEKAAGNALMQAPDAMTAAQIYSNQFLRPGIPHMDQRLAYARQMAGLPVTNGLAQPQQQQPQMNALAPPPMMAMLDMGNLPRNRLRA
jgi:Phage tail lysozyme